MASTPTLLDDVRGLLAETFSVALSQVDPATQLGELPQWDSMAHMDLMLALEANYGVEITAETISQLTSIPAIVDYIEKKQA